MKLIWILILGCLVGCGPVAIVDRMPNGNPILIRSPQPDSDDLENFVQLYKLKTVVNLRGERLKDWYFEEAMSCDKLSLRLIDVKASGRTPPTTEEISKFISLVRDPANYPILIHCQGGIHRTGVYVALYRLIIQKWKPEDALAELEDNYFDWTLVDREAIKEWIRHFQPE